MRLIGLVLALSLTLAPSASKAQLAEKRLTKDFPGGVVFVERIDEMSDERLCSVHTPMRGIEAVVSAGSVAFFVHERRGPVVRNPAPTLRLGQSKPIQLTPTDRPYLISVSKDRARETIEALYAHRRVLVRWYDLRRDEHTITLDIGDFGTAYDHAVAACGCPRLAVKRGAYVPPPTAKPTPTASATSDFPYAYYIQQISEKIQAQWNGRAIPGQQPTVAVEIRRDGNLNQVSVDKSSGNTYYDQVAIRAINDAGPFPPLLEDFKGSTLIVNLQLDFGPPASVKPVLPDERGGIGGEPISLNSTDPAYSGYLDRVRRMIKEKWGYPCIKDVSTGHCDYKSAEVLIEFGILQDGRVPYVAVIQPAEWNIYNDYAANAIRLSQPFPPAPPELMPRTTQGSAGVLIVGRFIYVLEGTSLTNELR